MKKNRKIFLVFTILLTIIILTNSFNIQGSLYVLFKGVPKQVVLAKTSDYNEVQTKNFSIRFDNGINDNTIKLVAETSEKHYDYLCSLYKYRPKQKPIVVIYSDSYNLMKNANLGESKPPMGVYYASLISILTPEAWIPEGYNIKKTFVKQGPMVHEVTHLLVDDITKGNCPLWFTEGLALYSEYITEDYEWGKDVSFSNVYTIEDLENFTDQDPYLAYTESFRKVKMIVDKYGFDKINDILELLGQGNKLNKAYENVTGNDIIELNI